MNKKLKSILSAPVIALGGALAGAKPKDEPSATPPSEPIRDSTQSSSMLAFAERISSIYGGPTMKRAPLSDAQKFELGKTRPWMNADETQLPKDVPTQDLTMRRFYSFTSVLWECKYYLGSSHWMCENEQDVLRPFEEYEILKNLLPKGQPR